MGGIKQVVKKIIRGLPGKQYIVLESYPDLCDNTKPVFDELLARGYDKRYTFVWWVKDQEASLPHFPNTVYVDEKTWIHRMKKTWYCLRAKSLICCNQFLHSSMDEIPSFYLTHGTTIKKLPGYALPQDITYTILASEGVRGFMAEALEASEDRFYPLGYPRNDVFFQKKVDLKPLFPGNYEKILVWYPTFRQHRNGLKTDAVNALPIIHDQHKAEELNRIAREEGVLLVLKPHFAQDVSYVRNLNLSNIRFIDDSFFTEHNITSYEFVGSCDGMITDYSSIYYDFLLCDKPVAVVWEDLEEYRRNPGIAVDLDYYLKGAEKIYTLEDFGVFLRNVARNRDPLQAKRREICPVVNCDTDGSSTQRVTDFIVEKSGL